MSSLPVIPNASVIPSADEWGTIFQMAKALIPTGFLPSTIKTAEQATAIILKGRELRIPPMYALSNIVVISGKPACGAELLQALVYRDHGDNALRFIETTDTHCTIEYRRRSWEKPERYSFTMQQAQQAGLNSNTWKAYPAAMLRARCISAVARMAFADSIGGMYLPDEMGATVRVVDGEMVYDAPPDDRVIEAQTVSQRTGSPQTNAIPEKMSDVDVMMDEPAVEKLEARAIHRGIEEHELVAIIGRRYAGAQSPRDLTREQGRELYRIIDKESDEGIQHERYLAEEWATDSADDEPADSVLTPRTSNPMFT